MNKDNPSLEEILASLPQYSLGEDPITNKPFTPEETIAIYPELKKALQAITKYIEEEKVALLQNILDTSSGGGSWRRNIILKIAKLRGGGDE